MPSPTSCCGPTMFEDDEEELEPKFGNECLGCKFVRRPRTCNRCESGEYFEEKDPQGLDFIFRD